MKRITITLCLSISVLMIIWTQSACSLAGTLTPERAAAAIKTSMGAAKSQKIAEVPSRVSTVSSDFLGANAHPTDRDHASSIPVVMAFKALGLLTVTESHHESTTTLAEPTEITTSNGVGGFSHYQRPGVYSHSVSQNVTVTLNDGNEALTRYWQKVDPPKPADPNLPAPPYTPQYTMIPLNSGYTVGWRVPIAEVSIDKITNIQTENFTDGDAKVTFTWHWNPTVNGKVFDQNDEWFTTLPIFTRDSLSGSGLLFDSSEIHAGMAIMNRDGTKWTVQEVRLNPEK